MKLMNDKTRILSFHYWTNFIPVRGQEQLSDRCEMVEQSCYPDKYPHEELWQRRLPHHRSS